MTLPRVAAHRSAVKSLTAGRKAPLGSREGRGALTKTLPAVRIHGEPKRFIGELAPTSDSRLSTSRWGKARERHLNKHEHIRKARHTSIGGWRRHGKRITSR